MGLNIRLENILLVNIGTTTTYVVLIYIVQLHTEDKVDNHIKQI